MLKVDEWRFFLRNRNFFILLRRQAEAPTYMHVFLLTLREVMNNFEARGLHFLLAAVRERYPREGEYEIGFSSSLRISLLYCNG